MASSLAGMIRQGIAPNQPALLLHRQLNMAALLWYIGGIILILKGRSLLIEAGTLARTKLDLAGYCRWIAHWRAENKIPFQQELQKESRRNRFVKLTQSMAIFQARILFIF